MTTVFPSPNEQYLLELTNRIRLDPDGELGRILTNRNQEINEALEYFQTDIAVLKEQWKELKPVPALAWSDQLHNSAATHNQRTIVADTQSHFLPNEPGLIERMREAGYDPASVAENIFAYPDSIEAAHASFALDWGNGPNGIQAPAGHRAAMTNGLYREVGIDITEERDPNTSVGTFVVTQHFGVDAEAVWGTSDAYLLGTIYNDAVKNDDFYTPGEGLGGVTVTAFDLASDRVFSTTTWDAGGYQFQLPHGNYRVEVQLDFNGDGIVEVVSRPVDIGRENLKLDVIADRDPENAVVLNAKTLPPSSNASNALDSETLVLEIGTPPPGVAPLDLAALSPADYNNHDTDRQDVLLGLLTDDTIRGAGGDDYITGKDGDDGLFGNRGNDTLLGGSGNDTVFGGRGNDALQADSGNDVVMADYGNDTVTGDRGDDILFGNGGVDRIDAGAGNDSLFGGADNDTLWGSAGDDRLAGQLGDDTLLGGDGRDVFVFAENYGTDVVVDFEDGLDRIGLLGLTLDRVSIAPHAEGVTVAASGASVTLLGLASGQLDASDFLLLS